MRSSRSPKRTSSRLAPPPNRSHDLTPRSARTLPPARVSPTSSVGCSRLVMPPPPSTRVNGPRSKRRSRSTRRPALAAPGERHGQPGAASQDVDEAESRAVGEAVAVVAAEDRQPHRLRLELAQRPGRRYVEGDTGLFLDDDHDQDGGEIGDRGVALSDLHAAEQTASVESLAHLLQQISVNGTSGAMPASRRTSASGVVWLPCTRMPATRSTAGAAAGGAWPAIASSSASVGTAII